MNVCYLFVTGWKQKESETKIINRENLLKSKSLVAKFGIYTQRARD